MTEMALASQQSTTFFPSQTASVLRKRKNIANFKETNIQAETKLLSYSKVLLIRHTQEQNESHTPSHVVGILLDLRTLPFLEAEDHVQ